MSRRLCVIYGGGGGDCFRDLVLSFYFPDRFVLMFVLVLQLMRQLGPPLAAMTSKAKGM